MSGNAALCFRIFLALILGLCRGHSFAESVFIEQVELPYKITVRGVLAAENAEAISAPVHRAMVSSVVPDGEYVEEGEIITEFDKTTLEFERGQLDFERGIIESDLKAKLTEIRNKELELKDRLAEQEDSLAYYQAKQARHLAMPLEEEIAIAQGRLRVAELEAEAAEDKLKKSQDRFERGMISPEELRQAKTNSLEKNALLEYARGDLELASLPATSLTLRKLALKIENAQMEIEQLKGEIQENVAISEIEKKGAEAKRELIDVRIQEKEEEMSKATVAAPISGHVMHLRDFKMRQMSHGTMWKNETLMRIPDQSDLHIKTSILEGDRKYFEEGDQVEVVVASRPQQPIPGRICSLSSLSRDRRDKEEMDFDWGGQEEESGIRVYDMEVDLEEEYDWVRPGMTARCTLLSSKTIQGPAVPLPYVRRKKDGFAILVNGREELVKGRVVQGFLILDDASFLKKTAQLLDVGQRKETTVKKDPMEEELALSGELTPLQSETVFVKDVWGWPKVSWVIDEDAIVQSGDEVAKLETKEIDEELQKLEAEYKGHLSERDSLREQMKLKRREGDFILTKEKNLLEIAEIEMKLLNEGLDWDAILQAELDLEQARIKVEAVTERLEETKAKRITSLSPLELARMEREKARQTLLHEKAKITLSLLERGASEKDRSKAGLDYLEQKAKVDTLDKEVETELLVLSKQLELAEHRVEHHEGWIDFVKERRENCVMTAPAPGLVRLNKITTSDGISKVTVGTEVGQGFRLMEIANVSQMYIRVEIPEAFFTQVAKGMLVEVRVPSLTEETLTGRVEEIEFLFENKRRETKEVGLYSSHEALGETIFHARIVVEPREGVTLKPGTMAEVVFPFEGGESEP